MPQILFLSPLPSWRRTTSSRRPALFPSRRRIGFHHIAVERALLVEQGRRGRAEAVRAVVAAGASIAVHSAQRLVQCVVGHWPAIGNWTSSRSRISAFGVGLALSATESIPEVVQYEVSISLGIVGHIGQVRMTRSSLAPRDIMLGRPRREFESKSGSIPVRRLWKTGTAWGVPAAGEPAVLFLQANTAPHLLVFPLVSAANDDKNQFSFK
jgi:hypothetical protein